MDNLDDNEKTTFDTNDDNEVTVITPESSNDNTNNQSSNNNNNNNFFDPSDSGCAPIIILLLILGIIAGVVLGIYNASNDNDSEDLTPIEYSTSDPSEEVTEQVIDEQYIEETDEQPCEEVIQDDDYYYDEPYEYYEDPEPAYATYLRVSPENLNAPWYGGDFRIFVYTNADEWEVDYTNYSWIHVTKYENSFTVHVDQNNRNWCDCCEFTVYADDFSAQSYVTRWGNPNVSSY